MISTRRAALAALAVAAFGCTSSGERGAPAPGAQVDSGKIEQDSAVLVDSATGPDAVVANDTGVSDAVVGDASVPTGCPSGYSGEESATPVSYPRSTTAGGGGELLAAITWDELTMAWTTKDGGEVVVHYGDRSDRTAAFTTEWTLPSSLGPFPEDKVALGGDGLTMLVMSADHKSIRKLTRASRGAPFDASSATSAPFERLTTPGEGGAPRLFADLVLSKDGSTLFFTDLARTEGGTIEMSSRLGDGTWDVPHIVDAPRLQLKVGSRRRPTGISADGNALFYFDEDVGAPYVGFRKPGTTEFVEFFAVVPTGRGAAPTEACDRLYMSVEEAPPKGEGGEPSTTVVHRIVSAQ